LWIADCGLKTIDPRPLFQSAIHNPQSAIEFTETHTMASNTMIKALPRTQGKKRITPASTGTADPRPITDYTAVLSTVSGHSRLTVTLSQPCIIRQPLWGLVDCVAGALVSPTSCTVVSNTQFYLDFTGVVAGSAAFVQPPYQDMQVQNFHGGFVRPGGQWFRAPVMP